MTEKIAGPITRGPFAHPKLSRILAHYGPRAFARSSACMGFIEFLDRIDARGRCALEVGTYHGITALLLAERFDRVISVSIDDEDPGKLLKRELAEFCGVTNIEFHDVKTNEKKAELIAGLDFDFAYSDGNHAQDTRADFALVERCGRVLFHEYWPLQAPVWNLVNSLPQHEVTRADVDILAFWRRSDG